MSERAQLYCGGDVYTVDPRRPWAQAVAVRDGQIVAVGSEPECRASLPARLEVVDLDGGVLLPGFIDTHLHPVPLIYFDLNVALRDVGSIAELQAVLRAAADQVTDDAWVVGLQFDEHSLREPRLPTRRDLDGACPDRPAIVIKHDGHMVIANTRAIEATGVTADTGAPEGGEIDREADGFPAGPFRETAAQLLLSAMPLPDLERFAAGAEATFRRLTRYGITSAGVILQTDAEGPAGAQGAFDIPFMQMTLDHVPINLYGILIASEVEQIQAAQETALHAPEPAGARRIGGLKIYSDGTFGSCTACMRAPFSDHPDRKGFMTLSEPEIYRRMVAAHAAGFQVAIHAIGDEANRRCIDLYDRLLREHPRPDHRHRLEHASLLDAGMIADCARLGIVISTQPMFIHSEKHWLHKRIGRERARHVYPLRDLIDAGVTVAGASDAPVESPDVLHAIQCCVTRDGFEPHQRITPDEAIRMYTIDAAYAQFEEDVKGSIAPGKRADFVLLNAHPARVGPDAIRDIRVERTVVSGRTVFDRREA